ncbi:MAG: PriCT-2 domain-containing protein [Chromatiales bacterium]|nr:PriCT-2 domain-containing protein [Chromatiales bacterium]
MIGSKSPGFSGWQNSKATSDQLREWIENGHKWSGVGILTRDHPAIDIDVLDEDAAKKIENWCTENIGFTPVRIGRAPKRLLPFRCDEPMRKRASSKYEDEWGQTNRIEVLGDGQQYVAFHTHPETGKPYRWVGGESLLDVPAHELPTLTPDLVDDLIEFFEGLASSEGWELVANGHGKAAAIDPDNPFVEDSRPIDIQDADLRRHLMVIPCNQEYDYWVRVGMALYHQYNGDELGFELWNEWSETAENYEREALDKRWEKFRIDGKQRAPITARYILRLAQEAAEEAETKLSMELNHAFLVAKNMSEWERAKKQARTAEINILARSGLANTAKAAWERITGKKVPLVDVKKALSYVPKIGELAPEWCRPWVYNVGLDRFFNLETKLSATQQGFNAMHDRHALTKSDILNNRAMPSQNASSLALNLYRIENIDGQRYEPGRDRIFSTVEGRYANTYPEHEIPKIPKDHLPAHSVAVRIIETHFAHLLPDPTERLMLIDWLAYIVQNPGERPNYAILLQGTPGDGKTFLAEMMRATMGPSNVSMLNAHILQSEFTDWAEGQCLAAVEEVRLIADRNKYETLNRIKPFITNSVIEVHPKGQAVRNVRNTTAYILFTNYKDAIPIDDHDRRYLVLFSQWQSRQAIDRFTRENPNYFSTLYSQIEEYPGAIRRWFLEHEFSPKFNPKGTAPITGARGQMIRNAMPECIQWIEDAIAENRIAEISSQLLDITFTVDYMAAVGIEVPPPKTLSMHLQRYGFELVGRFQINNEREHRMWTREPDVFNERDDYGNPIPNKTIVRKLLEQRRSEIDDDL